MKAMISEQEMWNEFVLHDDTNALGVLYDRYVDELVLAIYPYTRDLKKAEDMVQNAFIKLLEMDKEKKLEVFQNKEMKQFLSFMQWNVFNLIFLADNRSENARKQREEAYVEKLLKQAKSVPRFDLEEIRLCISKISKPMYQDVLNKVLEGKTNGEIAHELKRSKNDVTQYLFKAKRELRKLLEQNRD